MILAVLLVDTVLLAIAELMFLTLYVGPVPVPVSALVAALSLPWLVWQAGKSGGTVTAAGLPLVIWLVAIGVLGFAGPGDDMLLPLTSSQIWLSVLLVAAGLIPGAYTLARVVREMAAHPHDWPEPDREWSAED